MKRWVSLVLVVTAASCTDEPTSPDLVEKSGQGCELSSPAFPAPLADGAGPNFGRFNGTFGVSPSGEATYSLALEVPPGPSGLSPELALEYRSSDGEQYLGRGWSLAGFSSIARCNPNLRDDNVVEGVRYDSSDPLCLDGKRLYQTAMNGNDRIYRTRPDTFVRSWPTRSTRRDQKRSPSDVGGYAYTAGDQPHAVHAAGAAVYDYDAEV